MENLIDKAQQKLSIIEQCSKGAFSPTTSAVLRATNNAGTKADFLTWVLYMVVGLPSVILITACQQSSTQLHKFVESATRVYNKLMKPLKRRAGGDSPFQAILPTSLAIEGCKCPPCVAGLPDVDKCLAVQLRSYAVCEYFSYLAACISWRQRVIRTGLFGNKTTAQAPSRPIRRRAHGHGSKHVPQVGSYPSRPIPVAENEPGSGPLASGSCGNGLPSAEPPTTASQGVEDCENTNVMST